MPIDLNADVGEGLDAADEAILPLITSANIGCGGHAGDLRTMRTTVALAIEHDVGIGAHPGYLDREGFGRREIDISAADLRDSIRQQLEALQAVAIEAGARVLHVKPHGLLYNQAAADPRLARLVASVVAAWDPRVVLVGLAGSQLLAAGRAQGLAVAAEGFADRAYEPDGSLRPRSRPGSLHADPATVAAQAVSIAREGRAPLEGGGSVAVSADTLCLHGDEPTSFGSCPPDAARGGGWAPGRRGADVSRGGGWRRGLAGTGIGSDRSDRGARWHRRTGAAGRRRARDRAEPGASRAGLAGRGAVLRHRGIGDAGDGGDRARAASRGAALGDGAALATSVWTVSARADRVGLRLEGAPLAGADVLDLVSLPMLPGAVQLPPNGLPIVLMPDAPTVGGYPVPAVIAESDRHLTGQLRPGDSIAFEWIDEREARRRSRDRALRLAAVAAELT